MATSSFINEVTINDDSKARQFLCALEKSENDANKNTSGNKPYSDASREEIRNFFKKAQ